MKIIHMRRKDANIQDNLLYLQKNIVMKVDISRLYSCLVANFGERKFFNELIVPCWDAVDIRQDWLVPGWYIQKVLIEPKNSPYLWWGYTGIRMGMGFYSICFFAFFSGVMFSVIKNGNIKPQWNYWEMPRYLNNDFILQCGMMDAAIGNRNIMGLEIATTDMDIEGKQMFSLVHWIIHNYFPSVGVNDFDLFYEGEIPRESEIENLDEVLETFHRFGCACYTIAMYGDSESRLKDKRIWGGKGMSQIFNFYSR